MKLKTLKDLKTDCVVSTPTKPSSLLVGVLLETELRSEAIKWYNFLEQEADSLLPHGLKNYHKKIVGLMATQAWLIAFFNLTESDLK